MLFAHVIDVLYRNLKVRSQWDRCCVRPLPCPDPVIDRERRYLSDSSPSDP